MQYNESPAICRTRVYPLKKTGFSMVHYSANQAINDKKKLSLKYKIICFRSVTSTIHTSHLENMYIQVVLYLLFRLQSGRSNFTIENDQQISRVSSYMYLVWTSFNEMKKAYFQDQYRYLF